MVSLLIAVIYFIFISLGLPDSLLGAGWPTIQAAFGVPSSYAGFVSMAIASMTIVSALLSPRIIRKVHTKWIVIVSIGLTVAGASGLHHHAYGLRLLTGSAQHSYHAGVSPDSGCADHRAAGMVEQGEP